MTIVTEPTVLAADIKPMSGPPDLRADRYTGKVIVWVTRGRRILHGEADRHSHLEGRIPFFDNCCDDDYGWNSGYVLGDTIVTWTKPSIEDIDILWKTFGILTILYYRPSRGSI